MAQTPIKTREKSLKLTTNVNPPAIFSSEVKSSSSMLKGQDSDLKLGTKVALMAMVEIILLAIVKVIVGLTTGMVVLLADAVASFSDVLSIFASYIGLKMSQRAADKKFKYGYYKAESFAAFLASVLILAMGVEVLKQSIERLFVMSQSQDYLLAAGQVVVSVLVSIHLASYLMKTGKKINSLSLIDSARDKRSDVLSEIPVALGIAANYFKIPYLEGIIGLVLSFIILKVGITSGKESLFFLLDYFDDKELLDKVEKTILTQSKIVKKILNIRMRRAGTYIFGEAFIEINPMVEAKDIRNDLNNLHKQIAQVSEHLKDFSIFFEVPQINKVRIAVPIKENKDLKSEIATTFKETRFYIFVDVMEGKILESYTKPFPYRSFNFIGITNFFKSENVNIVINNQMHTLLFYNLRRLNHILVYPEFSNITDVENTIKLLVIDT